MGMQELMLWQENLQLEHFRLGEKGANFCASSGP